ncbi:MAG: argininosuccinate lyase [Acidobacteria bacterium]|nr:MAG: argininosuccinate lyase [Acidobacteriota bacterium]
MTSKKLWGGRFSSEADPLFDRFNASLPFDHVLLESDIQGNLAYARALERAGVFTARERDRVERGLRSILIAHRKNPRLVVESKAEDVHTYVEQELEKRVGRLALKLHTGRSRNDQVATDLRLFLRSRCEEIEKSLNDLLRAIAGMADQNREAILPGYTHLQRAQPVLFSHYLLAYGEQFLRDRERLRQTSARANVCPLGSGAVSGTVYGIGRDELARDLGFEMSSDNSVDSVSDRDFLLDFLCFSSTLMVHLSRLAEDLILYNSSEFGFIRLDDSVAGGSSLMPQKKNPDALELIRGKSGRVYGHLISLLTVLKGLPAAYNKDLQEDKESFFDAAQTVDNCTRMMSLVLQRTRILPDRMKEACLRGYLNATELADYLVAKKMPFRPAHELVGRIVLRAMELDVPLEQLPLEEYQNLSPLFKSDLYQALKLETSLSRRGEKGGTAPTQVRKALQAFRKKIER